MIADMARNRARRFRVSWPTVNFDSVEKWIKPLDSKSEWLGGALAVQKNSIAQACLSFR
jgi:hypothetical protein